jgi:L-seryl-tRNA(Ser) seleniumtransferase
VELRKLPKVDRVLEAPELAELRASLGRRALTTIAREVIARHRESVRAGDEAPDLGAVIRQVAEQAERKRRAGLRRIVNATGVILHTNFGRAPLSRASLERIAELCGGYLTLEYDAELGVRTRRGAAAETAIAELIGAGDALLVNNNAAAVLLALSTIAAGREIIVSRGELVEIGGGFRIPDVLARSGARLVEVGTTNRTRIEDYARAIGDRTAALLRVHPSNFRITGFAERPQLAELAKLARSRGLPLIKDLGGGLIVELAPEVARAGALREEPTAQACLAAGVDLVCFSLDKLFGGPQAGVVAGSSELVARLRDDPLARALRVDKLVLAALEPVLAAYARGALDEIVIFSLLHRTTAELRSRVEAWQAALGEAASRTRIVESDAAIGGGTLAEAPVSSVALAVSAPSADELARALRAHDPPVVGRISEDVLLLDARSVLPGEDQLVIEALRRALVS